MIFFLLYMAVYFLICLYGFKAYFFIQRKNREANYGAIKKGGITYLLFILFICTLVPFTLLFPAWLSETLKIADQTSESVMYFILFGGAVLALSIWVGRKSRPRSF